MPSPGGQGHGLGLGGLGGGGGGGLGLLLGALHGDDLLLGALVLPPLRSSLLHGLVVGGQAGDGHRVRLLGHNQLMVTMMVILMVMVVMVMVTVMVMVMVLGMVMILMTRVWAGCPAVLRGELRGRAGDGGRVLLPAEAALAPGRGIQQVAEVVHAPLH